MSTAGQKAAHLLRKIFDRRYRTLLKLEGGVFWDDVGPNQLAYLKAEGLRPEHRLLDLPCGCFRAGRLLIDYLEEGHYFGADASPGALEKGKRYVLEPEGLLAKRPDIRLLSLSAEPVDLEATFGVLFDYVWVHALFDHIPHEIIRQCLADLSRVLVPGGRLYATIFLNPHGPDFREPLIHPRYGSLDGAVVTYPDREFWHHDLEFFEEACDEIPDLRLDGCRFDYPHPFGLRMLSFTRPDR